MIVSNDFALISLIQLYNNEHFACFIVASIVVDNKINIIILRPSKPEIDIK